MINGTYPKCQDAYWHIHPDSTTECLMLSPTITDGLVRTKSQEPPLRPDLLRSQEKLGRVPGGTAMARNAPNGWHEKVTDGLLSERGIDIFMGT